MSYAVFCPSCYMLRQQEEVGLLMKTGEISELSLAAVIAGATLLGGVLSSAASALWIDANTEQETNVQLMQLAIGILSEPSGGEEAANVTLRAWAVATINAVAEVKFDDEAQRQLVDGTIELPMSLGDYLHAISELQYPPESIELEINGRKLRILSNPPQQQPEGD